MIAQNIRELRNHLNLSQTAFGERLNVSRNVINNLELGRVEPNDMMIAHICNTYGVAEKWLRTGSGPMMAATLDDELTALAQAHGLDEMDVALIRTYISLPRGAQSALKDFLRRLAAASPTPSSSAAPAITREEMDAIADRLDALEETALSSRDSPSP